MGKSKLEQLFETKVTRKEFLIYSGVGLASLLGIAGALKQILTLATTQTADKEAEAGTPSSAADIVNDTSASGGKALKFGGGQTTPPSGSYLMGVSASTHGHGGIANWDAFRAYNFSKVDELVTTGAKAVALTDEDIIPFSSGTATASADKLDTALTSLFNKHPNLTIHWANGNEVDTSAMPSNYVQFCAAHKAIIDKHKALGRDISMWVDLTTYEVRQTSDTAFKAIAPYLDGIACSMYPAGRKSSPLEYDDYNIFIKPVFDLAKDWGIDQVSCWEVGIGPDTNTTHPSSTNETATSVKVRKYGQSSLTTITVPNTKQVRPTYAAYMAKYIHDAGQAYGIATPLLLWWDSQKAAAGSPDDILSDDPSGTSPSTAISWKNWPTYVS